MSEVRIRLTGQQYNDVRQHLFPGDGKEAVAVALFGNSTLPPDRVRTVRRVRAQRGPSPLASNAP